MTVDSIDAEIADEAALKRAIAHLGERGIVLPTFAELAEPSSLEVSGLDGVDPDAPDPRNLARVHWWNDPGSKGLADVPAHIVLPPSLTGVAATIVALRGDTFPMITAHKVLAAYACLAPRLATGRFDPTRHRAIWPSTGNYCRGGIAISRILGCRGVAVLPEGMSAERFRWLDDWVEEPEDIVRTPGTESNVKEIYDCCAKLASDPQNIVLNQFAEFGNHLGHFACTGRAAESVVEALRAERRELQPFAFVSATGSAGTIGAGDYLKDRYGAHIAAVEALECPTLSCNGFGEHNIQGIGDKHVPLIHNVTNTDYIVAVSDRATDELNVLFNHAAGREVLRSEYGLNEQALEALTHLGLSSLCNVLACIKLAKREQLGPDALLVTVATDGAAMYASEVDKAIAVRLDGQIDADRAARIARECLGGAEDDHVQALGQRDRDRVFNLGYFTWVEQQGVSLDDFEARRDQAFWRDLRPHLDAWDERIRAVNAESGAVR